MIGTATSTTTSRVLPRWVAGSRRVQKYESAAKAASIQPSSESSASKVATSITMNTTTTTTTTTTTNITTTASNAWRFLDSRYRLAAVVAGTAAAAGWMSCSETKGQQEQEEGQQQNGTRTHYSNFHCYRPTFVFALPTTFCEDATQIRPCTTMTTKPSPQELEDDEEIFLETIRLYQRWLQEIKKQWAISSPSPTRWPNSIPSADDISALEVDLQNYRKGGQGDTRLCQDLEFRIACYYLFQVSKVEEQRKGFQMAKKLAVNGHPDGLCLYALMWNRGGIAGMEAQPHLAVKYWRQAASKGHLASMYELAVALYMGDGAVENPAEAVKYFKKAADLGHSGAAYLLADCYLDGIGVEQRSRAKALEWLMAAAEMGHRQAQRRAEALLTATDSSLEEEESNRWKGARPADWYREVPLERRFSIGGGSRNPLILRKRRTAVAESRKSEE